MTKSFIISWSGGKDSALAYFRAVRAGHAPFGLLTMFEEGGDRSRSHGLPEEVLQAQAERMGMPLTIGRAGWETYEAEFKDRLQTFSSQGIELCVYGDIDLEGHKEWAEKVTAAAGMEAYHPLWQEPRKALLRQLIEEEFQAVITVVDTERMSERFLGRTLTAELMDELEALGIDACGEEGEFHTVIADGPIFVERVPLEFGDVIDVGRHKMLDVTLKAGK
ncbi:diphthine--ammonia ligase [Indiicoccus explosivorum]|uniref:Dph6-related ATP pyrophosphatase n=1 Tax=Indiicoccus explosivorum TaxID=1917864 RepID=UPI000B44C523|nr:diphthine--ammonia ligase [Indiicoccus explosivorum]